MDTLAHHDVIVIGGGQAGLAIGYHLARAGRQFTILDAADTPAAAWRSRWDSLKLFTPARYDGLPGRTFPGDPGHYPARDEVVDYLTAYARDFELPVELNRRVRAVRPLDHGYLVETDDVAYESAQVVIATGPFQTPRIPSIAKDLAAEVHQIHSGDYRRPADVADGPVLVVGGGNTGYQIAHELAATHEVHLAIGSRLAPLPQRLFGRDLFTILTATGLMGKTVDSRIGHRLSGRDALIGSSPSAIRRQGVRVRSRVTSATGSSITFADGSALDARTVIWATGFGVDYSYLDAPVFSEDGAVIHSRGVTAAPGLYFLGMPWQHTRGSALLGWVKDDAQHIADQIARARSAQNSPRPRQAQGADTIMTTATVAGLLLIAVSLAFNSAFALLATRFDYPHILRQPTADVLAKFTDVGTPLVLLWWAFALTALLMVPLVVLLSSAISDAVPTLVSVATTVGVLAAAVQFLGLIRWPFLVPYLARTAADPTRTPPGRRRSTSSSSPSTATSASQSASTLATSSPEPGPPWPVSRSPRRQPSRAGSACPVSPSAPCSCSAHWSSWGRMNPPAGSSPSASPRSPTSPGRSGSSLPASRCLHSKASTRRQPQHPRRAPPFVLASERRRAQASDARPGR